MSLMVLCSTLAALLAVSGTANVVFFLKSKKQKIQKSYEVHDLMTDLLTGGEALVRISRIAPNDVLIRSPRGI